MLWPSSPRYLLKDTDLEVVYAPLDVPRAVRRELEPLLSAVERARAARFAYELPRQRYIVARARLRLLLSQRLDAAPESIEIRHLPRGKPVLGGPFAASGLTFNLSHSDNVAVFAFARDREVGVDVETVRVLEGADRIAERFFSRGEYRTYLSLPEAERKLGFLNCWTRKEAFIKATGDGLHYPLDSFEVSLAPDQLARILRIGNRRERACTWTLRGFSFDNLVGAVATQQVSRAHHLCAAIARSVYLPRAKALWPVGT